MKEVTLLDKIFHFIYHRRYFIENHEDRLFTPRWQNVWFNIPSNFAWWFQERGHFMNQVSFKTERQTREFLLRSDVDSLRFDVKETSTFMRVK